MAKIRKIKIYTYHKSFLHAGRDLSMGKRLGEIIFGFFYFIGSFVFGFFRRFVKAILMVCFFVGNAIIGSGQKLFWAAAKDIKNTKKFLPQRIKLLLRWEFSRALLLFFSIALIGYAGIGALRLIAKALELKSQVTQTASLGNSYLAEAKDALSAQDLGQAQSRFLLAYGKFSQGEQELQSSGLLLNQLLNLSPQKQSAQGLLSAAQLIASSGEDLVNLEQKVGTLKFGPSGLSSGGQPGGQTLTDIAETLDQLAGKIDQADDLVQKVDPSILPQDQSANLTALKLQLTLARQALDNLDQLFALAQGLFTGQKTALLIFENNNELRAGGGFMGSFGALKLNNGQISKINVSSIYDLDGQLTDVIKPPQPILNVSDRWYLRDSNWFADFPTTAKKISDFYENEGGETPDMIIALTPNLIIDWLKIIGPIYLPKYNVTLTADNFIEQTQSISTISDNLPTNSPKQILADLLPILLQKISALGASSYPQIIQSLQDNLNGKQIVIYSRDPQTQNQLQAFHWTGDLSPQDRDYLSVVSSNLGGTKSDLEVDQTINLTTTINPDGSIIDELDLTRTDRLPNLPDTNNNSFIRVYAPLGSKLISNLGFDYNNLSYPPNEQYKIDPDVYNWEKNSVTDNLTGTIIGQESGKTFFGNWLNILGGQSRTVKLVYQLPFKLSDIDRYSLLLQKQIGSTNSDFNWNLNFASRQIIWKDFDSNNLNADNLSLNSSIDKDYFWGMVLQKR